MLTDIEYRKLVWHSRRGMLELDLLLLPFARHCLHELDDDTLDDYRRLLEEEDQDLFAWLVNRQSHPEPRLQELIARIRAHTLGSREK